MDIQTIDTKTQSELTTLKFKKQLALLKLKLDRIMAEPTTSKLFYKYFPIKF